MVVVGQEQSNVNGVFLILKRGTGSTTIKAAFLHRWDRVEKWPRAHFPLLLVGWGKDMQRRNGERYSAVAFRGFRGDM